MKVLSFLSAKACTVLSTFLFPAQVPTADHLYQHAESCSSLLWDLKQARFSISESSSIKILLVGQGMDFLDKTKICITDAPNLQNLQWRTLDCKETNMVVEASFQQQLSLQSLQVRLYPDTHPDEVAIQAARDDHHQNADARSRSERVASWLVNERFLPQMMKLAWAHMKLYNLPDEENEILQALSQMDTFVGPDQEGRRTFRSLIHGVGNTNAIDQVGETPSARVHIEHVLNWLCPSDGHVLYTTSHVAGKVVIGLIALAASICIVASGGLGLIGPMVTGTTASLTGGWGSAVAVCGMASGMAWQFYSRVNGVYQSLLCDLYTWTGATEALRGNDEFRMEEALMNRVQRLQAGQRRVFAGPYHSNSTQQTEKKLQQLYEGVVLVHKMKMAAGSLTIVGIAGPQNAGKTLLISQLMMDASIAKRGSGLNNHTLDNPPHKLTSSVLLWDSPGLSSPDPRVRVRFYLGADSVASYYIYIRPFQAVQAEDIDTVYNLLMRSTMRSPPLLICLNKIGGLEKDGSSDEYYSADELQRTKDRFLQRLKDSIRERLRSEGWSTLWGHHFESRARAKWNNVEVVFSELQGALAPADAPEELQHFLQNAAWRASDIGRWMQRKIDPEGQDSDLREQVERIDRAAWKRQRDALVGQT